MTEPVIDRASERDLVEQRQAVAPDEGAVLPDELPVEAPEADVLEQAADVPADDEDYRA